MCGAIQLICTIDPTIYIGTYILYIYTNSYIVYYIIKFVRTIAISLPYNIPSVRRLTFVRAAEEMLIDASLSRFFNNMI